MLFSRFYVYILYVGHDLVQRGVPILLMTYRVTEITAIIVDNYLGVWIDSLQVKLSDQFAHPFLCPQSVVDDHGDGVVHRSQADVERLDHLKAKGSKHPSTGNLQRSFVHVYADKLTLGCNSRNTFVCRTETEQLRCSWPDLYKCV